MTPQEFINKWKRATLTERSACQQHFLDLCDLLSQPKPAAADPDGAWYTFEKGIRTNEGGQGFADVWLKDKFGWEYKGKHKDLVGAYRQLLKYREALENPPLLVVCDMDRFEIHTNFTGSVKKVYAFGLDELAQPANLDILRKLFSNPEALKPGLTTARITEEAAERFATLSDGMRSRGIAAPQAAHFLMKLMFCMFAEDIALLPEKLFTKIIRSAKTDPARLSKQLRLLFDVMSKGGDFGSDEILYFNGGLFADAEVIDLSIAEIEGLGIVNEFDWSQVEPSIFGTLFERTLDPAKRSQIGAHYTSREDIETLLNPVMMAPLRAEWENVKDQCSALLVKIKKDVQAKAQSGKSSRKDSDSRKKFEKLIRDYLERIAHVTVLDPACGSGNFLYVAINLLLDLEKEVLTFASQHDISLFPQVRPTQLAGIEINPYAHELAQVVIWIGYLQWMHHNGFNPPRDPVLEPIDTIRNMDAILDLSNPQFPQEPSWPYADFIIGNPPFLGGNRIREALGDEYVDSLFKVYSGKLGGFSDLCCYWFEKSRVQILNNKAFRAGLLATQGIRGGVNREVLKNILDSGGIFFAVSDRDWFLDGAMVHVSMVGFDNGSESNRILDGHVVNVIPPNLAVGTDITIAKRLQAMSTAYHEGTKKGASFELSPAMALEFLEASTPHGLPNSDVIRPYTNGVALYNGTTTEYIVYFHPSMTLDQASKYEAPFEFIKRTVFPKYGTSRLKWWIHERPRPDLASNLDKMERYIATVRHSKHRIFVWLNSAVLPDSAIGAITWDDAFSFAVLHSRIHEVWARSQGTQVRERESGLRYTPTSCFETFPFPISSSVARPSIELAANELESFRSRWLNPPDLTRETLLEFPGSIAGPWKRFVSNPNTAGIGTVRYPRLIPKDEACAAKLKKRTLTNLYNERPTWLDLAHKKLDEAVFAAYGWPPDLTDDEILSRLLALNLERAAEEAKGR